MARARSGGGGNGSIWGLVLFGAGFFICMILAIVFYTKIEAAQQDAEAANQSLRAVINDADENNPALARITAEKTGTTVAALVENTKTLEDQVAEFQRQVSDIEGQRTSTQNQLEQQQQATRKAEADVQQAVVAKQELGNDLSAKVTALTKTVSDISEENTRLQGLIGKSVTEIDAKYQDSIAGLRTQTSDLSTQVTERDRSIQQLKVTIEELRGKRPENVDVTLADARVVAQIQDQNKVYLDIGRDANLTLGMPFKVYDADDIVKIEDPESEGKAIIEIININSNSAVGRIVERQPRAVINNGDVLVNVIFDPNRIFKFHVFGQFDLNYDGDVDEGGTEQVRSMVERFNGELSESLGFATDYLVLGVEPELPSRPDDELDLIKMKEYRVQLENYQAYQDRITEAKELGIPVLNQNRFLDLVGYFQR